MACVQVSLWLLPTSFSEARTSQAKTISIEIPSSDHRARLVGKEKKNAKEMLQKGSRVLLHISAVVTVINLIYIMLISVLDEGKTKYIALNVFLLLSICVGIIYQVLCLWKKSDPTFVEFEKLGHEHSTKHLMVGIYVFGVGTLFGILLRLLVYYREYERVVPCDFQNISQTLVQNGTSSNSTHAKPHVPFGGVCYMDFVLDLFRLVFTLVQLYFIQTFRKGTSTGSIILQVTLYVTIVANIHIWFHYLYKEMHFDEHNEYNWSVDQLTTKALQMEEVMTPFILEYCLLATGLLRVMSLEMWTFGRIWMGSKSSPREVRVDDSITHEITNIDARNDIPMDASNISTREEQECLPMYSLQDGDDVDTAVRHSNRRQERQAVPRCCLGLVQAASSRCCGLIQSNPRYVPGLICGTFCGLLLLVSALMFNDKQNKPNRRSHNFFLVYEGILAFLQAVAISSILASLKYQIKCSCKVDIKQFLFAIVYLVTAAFHVIVLYSVSSVPRHSPENRLTAVLSILHLLSLIISQALQFYLLIIVKSQYCSLTGHQESKAQTIRSLTLFLLTTNVGFWALDSFIEMKDNASSSYPIGKEALGHKWKYVTSICYPFAIFYRFQSAEMLYEFWSEVKIEE